MYIQLQGAIRFTSVLCSLRASTAVWLQEKRLLSWWHVYSTVGSCGAEASFRSRACSGRDDENESIYQCISSEQRRCRQVPCKRAETGRTCTKRRERPHVADANKATIYNLRIINNTAMHCTGYRPTHRARLRPRGSIVKFLRGRWERGPRKFTQPYTVCMADDTDCYRS